MTLRTLALYTLATLAYTHPSYADSCEENWPFESDGPQPSRLDVPLNSAVFFRSPIYMDDESPPELDSESLGIRYKIQGPDSVPIGGTWHVIRSRGNTEFPLVFFVPETLFSPMTEYRVLENHYPVDAGTNVDEGYPFVTGIGLIESDVSPPNATFATQTYGYGYTAARVTLTGERYVEASSYVTFDVASSNGKIALLLNQEDEADFDSDTLSGIVADIALDGRLTASRGGACASAKNWEGLPGSSGTFYVGLVDRSGAFSGWSDPIEVQSALISTCECVRGLDVPLGRGSIALLAAIATVCYRRRPQARVIGVSAAG